MTVLDVVKSGPDWELETEAHAILIKDRRDRGLRSNRVNSEEYSWLSFEQLDLRQKREICTEFAIGDMIVPTGMYMRAWNPMIGTRPRRPVTV